MENEYKMYSPQTSQYLWSIVKTNFNRSPAITYQEVFNKRVEKSERERDHLYIFNFSISKLYFSGAHPEFLIGGADPGATYILCLILQLCYINQAAIIAVV